MNWIAQNEAPEGYEPVYSVIEPSTGRDIALNLEEKEALKIANCEEAFNLLEMLIESFEELYTHTTISHPQVLDNANDLITKTHKLISKIKWKNPQDS